MTKGTIYSIMCKVNGKRYVGQTDTTLEQRWKEHIKDSKKSNKQRALYKDIHRYGVGMFVIREIEQVDTTMLDERERHWISEFDTFENGYNDTSGGFAGYVRSNEFKVGRRKSSNKAGFQKGKIANPTGGMTSRVKGTNIQTGEIVEFKSIKEAAQFIDVNPSGVSGCLSGRHKSAGGYTWERIGRGSHNHKVYGKRILDGKIVGPFDSINQAVRELDNGKDNSTVISRALKNPSRYSWKGCRWYYQEEKD